jgi:hypothetical protein
MHHLGHMGQNALTISCLPLEESRVPSEKNDVSKHIFHSLEVLCDFALERWACSFGGTALAM